MYKIVAGDYIVHQSNTIDKDFLAVTAKLEHELNKSGTLNFSVPVNNYAFTNHALMKLKVPIYIYYNDKEVWRGRILDTNQNFYNTMAYKCEGWLSVLCDSIVRPENNITVELTEENIASEFKKLIDNHNSQVEEIKQFNVHFVGFKKKEEEGGGEHDDKPVDKKIHELALECINGDWGNGEERKQRLTEAGYDYEAVQAEVNRIIWSGEDYDAEYEELHPSTELEEDELVGSEDILVGATNDESSTGPSAAEIIAAAESYLGTEGVASDAKYLEILDLYNSYLPHPRNIEMEVGIPWCDAFVSAIFIKLKGIDLLGGPECYVDSHIANFKTVGIWTEDTSRTPEPGDLITFNWDGDGETDHIGIVKSVSGTTITTIEGNSGNTVANQTYQVAQAEIRGYATPKYGKGKDTSDSEQDNRTYYNTLDYIMQMFINNEDIGGTIYCEGNNLYYYAKDQYREVKNAQEIIFANNLLDFNNYVDASEVYTCLIPEGKDGLLLTGKKTSPTGKDTLYGIDVSHWNEPIDWSLAKSDLDVVITSVTQSDGSDNPSFESTYSGCTSNGILLGAYKYSYALSGEQSRAEAQLVVSKLNNRHLDFPIFIDLEWENQEWLETSIIRDIIVEFEKVVVNAGYMFGIYCTKYWYEAIIPAEFRTKYDFWIASVPYDENDDGTMQERLKPNYEGCNLVGWQYSFHGHFSWGGTTPNFDLDVFYTDYSSGHTMSSSEDSLVGEEEEQEEEVDVETSGSQTNFTQDWIENEQGIELFGKIFRHESFSDIETVAELYAKGVKKLEKAIEEATTIEISAFDLSLIDVDYSAISLGTKHKIISKPHGVNEDFVCSSLSLDLCNPANNRYIFGVQPKTLTKRYNSLYSNVYNRTNTINNYIYKKDETDNVKINIRYTIISGRVEFDNISFYKLGSIVYLDFTAKYLKKVNNGSAIMKFDTKYAPNGQSVGIAFNETNSTNFTIKASGDGQIVMNCDGFVPKNSIVDVTIKWQYKGV